MSKQSLFLKDIGLRTITFYLFLLGFILMRILFNPIHHFTAFASIAGIWLTLCYCCETIFEKTSRFFRWYYLLIPAVFACPWFACFIMSVILSFVTIWISLRFFITIRKKKQELDAILEPIIYENQSELIKTPVMSLPTSHSSNASGWQNKDIYPSEYVNAGKNNATQYLRTAPNPSGSRKKLIAVVISRPDTPPVPIPAGIKNCNGTYQIESNNTTQIVVKKPPDKASHNAKMKLIRNALDKPPKLSESEIVKQAGWHYVDWNTIKGPFRTKRGIYEGRIHKLHSSLCEIHVFEIPLGIREKNPHKMICFIKEEDFYVLHIVGHEPENFIVGIYSTNYLLENLGA